MALRNLLLFFSFLLLSAQMVLFPSQLAAQNGVVYESGGVLIQEQAAYNVHHYDLDLKVDPADSTISGTVVIHADIVHPTDLIIVDLDPRFTVESIRSVEGDSQRDLAFESTSDSKRIRVYFPSTRQSGERFVIEISYYGKPMIAANPPWDGGFVWETTPSGDPWIGVACQSIGAWVWWPNKDHPSDKADSVALNFTLPDGLEVASNGHFRGTSDVGEGWTTWHWFNSSPISNYNVTLNAAPYKTISQTYESVAGDEMEITFWVLSEYYEQGEKLFPQFARQMRFLEELLGPYPFRNDKYGVVHTPYLGMEHQSIIAYGANFRNDNLFGQDIGFDDLHQHELAHEWWGNMVTAWDWRDFWIHEGFATYMQALYAEHLAGQEGYRSMMQMKRDRIIAAAEIAPRQYMTTVEVTGSGRVGDIYYKGAWFLHTLRYLIGDEMFFKSLRRFAYPDSETEQLSNGSHIRFATTDDYLHLVNELTGDDLGWVFEVYLRTAGLPQLRVERTEESLWLEWNVVDDLPFPMPVEVRIDGELRQLHPGTDGIEIGIMKETEVEIDPGGRILMRKPDPGEYRF